LSDTVIKIENLSKKYILRHQNSASYGTLRDSLTNLGKKINPVSWFDDSKTKSSKEEFWALKDINLEIKQGDKLGIIGRNGAGKSTLLKILSRITEPTTGSVKIKGRISSLLEVGTGFHPELSGRENIFLNGAILGMSKQEIHKKFDEIVDFSGIEKFLDTPVKRYSSGMYVRLAFGVAAHLESEILLIDEVLAVGDAEFQKKCLGKMDDISRNGRTIVFVSHDMGAIHELCNYGILLDNGKIKYKNDMDFVIEHYMDYQKKNISHIKQNYTSDKINMKIPSIIDFSGKKRNIFHIDEGFICRFELELKSTFKNLTLGIALENIFGNRLFTAHSIDDPNFKWPTNKNNKTTIDCSIRSLNLSPGYYKIFFGLRNEYNDNIFKSEYPIQIEISDNKVYDGTDGVLRYSGSWRVVDD